MSYYEPPTAWQSLTDAGVLDWFWQQDARYQQRIIMASGVWANNPDPTLTEIVTYLRKQSAPLCECGYDGSPRSVHVPHTPEIEARLGRRRRPTLELQGVTDGDDDLPF